MFPVWRYQTYSKCLLCPHKKTGAENVAGSEDESTNNSVDAGQDEVVPLVEVSDVNSDAVDTEN